MHSAHKVLRCRQGSAFNGPTAKPIPNSQTTPIHPHARQRRGGDRPLAGPQRSMPASCLARRRWFQELVGFKSRCQKKTAARSMAWQALQPTKDAAQGCLRFGLAAQVMHRFYRQAWMPGAPCLKDRCKAHWPLLGSDLFAQQKAGIDMSACACSTAVFYWLNLAFFHSPGHENADASSMQHQVAACAPPFMH